MTLKLSGIFKKRKLCVYSKIKIIHSVFLTAFLKYVDTSHLDVKLNLKGALSSIALHAI